MYARRKIIKLTKYLKTIPVVLIILFGVAPVAANILGVLLGGTPPPVVAAPTVVTAKLPGGGFFTGTTTLLQRKTLYPDQKRLQNRTSLLCTPPPGKEALFITYEKFSDISDSSLYLFSYKDTSIILGHEQCSDKYLLNM